MDWRLPGMNGVEASRRIRHSLELQPTPVILMISAFDRHDIAPTEETGAFDEFLVKPLKEDTFLDAVWSLLGGAQAAPVAADIPPSVNQAALDGRHVLLAEDNDLNRDLATELLTDLGFHVLVAPDGQAAVDIVHAHHVDLILMDIQMPHMDGLTAARIIRSDRRFDGTPIIAMTAHAMTGDRERSLGAGMNDHITKPIDPDLLARTLVRWMPVQRAVAPRVEAAAPAGPVPEQLPPFDIQAALLRTNNKPLLLRKLLLGFRQQYAGAVAELKAFLAEEKWAEAQRLVHSLKSIAATLETKPLAEAAGAIEAALRDGQRTDLDPLIDTFDLALRPAIAAVATLDQGEPAYSTK
jgi:two-component system sensor histidine kinase/response regulator